MKDDQINRQSFRILATREPSHIKLGMYCKASTNVVVKIVLCLGLMWFGWLGQFCISLGPFWTVRSHWLIFSFVGLIIPYYLWLYFVRASISHLHWPILIFARTTVVPFFVLTLFLLNDTCDLTVVEKS